MPRFRFDHPRDRRLHAEYGDEGRGLFLDLWLEGDIEPSVRFANVDEVGWEQQPPLLWQVIEILNGLGFLPLTDFQEAMELEEAGRPPPARLRPAADLLKNLRELSEA